MAWSLFLLLPFLVSMALCRLLMAVSVKDAPDGERKTQAAPVPTAGGLAILAALGVTFAAFGLLRGENPLAIAGGLITVQPYGGWVLFVAALGLLGFVDDGLGLPAILKLVLLAGLCGAAGFFLPAIDLALPGLDVPAPEDGAPMGMVTGLAIWLLVMINASNFMDGADGLAFGCLAIMLAGVGIGLGHAFLPMLDFIGPVSWAVLLAPPVTIMAIGGFLVWNLRGAIYAGDTGALSVGGLFAVLGAYSAAHVGIWFPLVLALPFLVDVGMTLAYRAVRRQPLLKAHRDHAYQLFIRRGASPRRVAALWWGFSLLCLAAAVSILGRSAQQPTYGILLFAGLLSLGVSLWLVQRWVLRGGRRGREGASAPVQLTPGEPRRPVSSPAAQ